MTALVLALTAGAVVPLCTIVAQLRLPDPPAAQPLWGRRHPVTGSHELLYHGLLFRHFNDWDSRAKPALEPVPVPAPADLATVHQLPAGMPIRHPGVLIGAAA